VLDVFGPGLALDVDDDVLSGGLDEEGHERGEVTLRIGVGVVPAGEEGLGEQRHLS